MKKNLLSFYHKRTIIQPTCILFTAIIAISLFSNCTIIGLAAGASVSGKQNKARASYELSIEELKSIPQGTRVEVLRKHSRRLEGWFVKIDELESENNTLQTAVIIDVSGYKKHYAIPLNDIKKLIKGERTSTPTLVGTSIGAGVDTIFWMWLAKNLNELFSGDGH
ncbi:MAG: hypothetical protein IPN76_08525 [Saprospiraceae bacterium]|nr:hypothetical protein [Saprospiraceae bacterium]